MRCAASRQALSMLNIGVINGFNIASHVSKCLKGWVLRMQEAQAQNQAAMEQAGGFGGRRLASASTGNLDELYQQHAARMDAGGLGNGFGAGGGAGGGMRGAASASQLWDAQMQVSASAQNIAGMAQMTGTMLCPIDSPAQSVSNTALRYHS